YGHLRILLAVPTRRSSDRMQRALEAGVKEIAIFTAASETFNQRNINASISESLERFAPVMEMARAHGIQVRGYVSCAIGCPYEGDRKSTRLNSSHVKISYA